jgi:hypothetical protein
MYIRSPNPPSQKKSQFVVEVEHLRVNDSDILLVGAVLRVEGIAEF